MLQYRGVTVCRHKSLEEFQLPKCNSERCMQVEKHIRPMLQRYNMERLEQLLLRAVYQQQLVQRMGCKWSHLVCFSKGMWLHEHASAV